MRLFRTVLALAMVLGMAAASAQPSQGPGLPPLPKLTSPRVYVLDCGTIISNRPEGFGLTRDDVFNPNFKYLIADRTEELEDTAEVELPDKRSFRRTARVAAVHIVEQYSECELIYYVRDADGKTRRLVHGFLMRWYSLHEMEHLLARCNFRVKAVFGDFNRSPLTDESPEMIFIAERI